MNREQAREYMRTHAHEYLTSDRSGKGYICPLCGNGAGESGTGLRSKDSGIHFKCFKCGFYGDIIDLIAKEQGLTDGGSGEAFELARKAFNIEVDNTPYTPHTDYTHSTEHKQNTQKTNRTKGGVNMEEVITYIKDCRAKIANTDYLTRRGIRTETAERLNIGYDEKAGAIIIPTQTKDGIAYVERLIKPIREDVRYINRGSVGLFNVGALSIPGTVFVTEGAIDALSIAEVGGNAVALNSVSNSKLFIAFLNDMIAQENPLPDMIYIAMDNDEAGQRAAVELAEGLKELGLRYGIANVSGACKDANDSLLANRGIFAEVIKEYSEGTRATQEIKPVREYLQGFLNDIKRNDTPAIPTHFKKLDETLGGGLFEGLYVIGAVSSLGKTTLTMQIADQIAQGGRDVIIFSLEMARSELMAKSISRHTVLDALANNIDTANAKTQLGITEFSRYVKYNDTEKAVIRRAIEAYGAYSDRLYIYEGIGDIGVKEVRDIVKRHIFLTGNTPVVIIDYLQILAPYDVRATDKQNTDKAVLELKRISRDYKLPLIAISSFNREAYTGVVSMASFKESGAIEYSSDVLIGLQLAELKVSKDGTRTLDRAEVDKAYKANPRKIELKILKNRKGRIHENVLFEYNTNFNLFIER